MISNSGHYLYMQWFCCVQMQIMYTLSYKFLNAPSILDINKHTVAEKVTNFTITLFTSYLTK